jgi:hypothetical protein
VVGENKPFAWLVAWMMHSWKPHQLISLHQSTAYCMHAEFSPTTFSELAAACQWMSVVSMHACTAYMYAMFVIAGCQPFSSKSEPSLLMLVETMIVMADKIVHVLHTDRCLPSCMSSTKTELLTSR